MAAARILYLGTNRSYMNNNQNLVVFLILRVGDTTLYGPGFQSQEVLEQGLRKFVEKTGPYDVVVTDAVILFWEPEKGGDPFKTCYTYFDYETSKNAIADMQNFFEDPNCDIQHKIFYPNFDPYPVSKSLIERLENIDTLLFTRDSKFWLRKEEMEDLNKEKFSDNVNDNWADFIKNSDEKIVSFLGTIGELEFSYSPLSVRPYDISVPGVGYYNRKVAFDIIKKSNLNMHSEGAGIRRKIRSRIALLTSSRNSLISYQSNFRQAIEDSKACFTCGSALRYPIRKFFEIPAMGSLLFCKPFAGFNELGFSDGVNSVLVEPQFVDQRWYELFDDGEKAQNIASSGQKMVMRLHSFSARLNQLDLMFDKILQNNFAGSVWKNGELKIM